MCPELTIPSSCKRQRPFPGFHVSFIPCSSGSNSKSWFLFLCPPEYLSPASISMTLRILKHSSNDSSEMLLAYVFFCLLLFHPPIHPSSSKSLLSGTKDPSISLLVDLRVPLGRPIHMAIFMAQCEACCEGQFQTVLRSPMK